MSPNIALFGPYGSGKGTQARILKEKFGMSYFDTGEVLRDNVKNETEIGKRAQEFMNRGDLVSDELIMEVVADWISRRESINNLLFDGIPRTLEQAIKFDAILKEKNISAKRIFINISEQESIQRQIGRKICATCGEIYPYTFKSEVCAKDEGPLTIRKENSPEIATKRAGVYKVETMPVIEYYREQGALIEIDGTLPVNKVTEEILRHI